MSNDIEFYFYTKMPHTSTAYERTTNKNDKNANYTKCGDLPKNMKDKGGQKYCPVKSGYFYKGFAGQTCKPPSDIDKHYMTEEKIYDDPRAKNNPGIIDKNRLDFSGAKTKFKKTTIDKSTTWGQEKDFGVELCDTHEEDKNKPKRKKTIDCDPLYKRDMNAKAEDYDCGDGYASIYDIKLPSDSKFKKTPYNINEPRHFYDIEKIYPTYTNNYQYYSVKNIGGSYLGSKFIHGGHNHRVRGNNDPSLSNYHSKCKTRYGRGPGPDRCGEDGMQGPFHIDSKAKGEKGNQSHYRWTSWQTGEKKVGGGGFNKDTDNQYIRHPTTKVGSNKWSFKFNNPYISDSWPEIHREGPKYEKRINEILKKTDFKINDESLYLKHQQPACPILHGVSPSKVRYIDLPNYSKNTSYFDLHDIHKTYLDSDEAFPSERILKCSYDKQKIKENSSNVYKWLDYKNRHQNFPVYRSLYDYVKLSNINFGLDYKNMKIDSYSTKSNVPGSKKYHKKNRSLNYYIRGYYGHKFKDYINKNLNGINEIYSESCKKPYVTYLDADGKDKMGSLDTCRFTSEQSKSHLCNYEGDNYESKFIKSISDTNTNIKSSLSNVTCPPLVNPKYNNGIQGYKPQFIDNDDIDPKTIFNLGKAYPIKSSYTKDWFGFQKGIDIPLRKCNDKNDGDPTKLKSYKCYDLKKGKEADDMYSCKTEKALTKCIDQVKKCHQNKKISDCSLLSDVSDKNPCLMDNRYMLFNECHNKKKEDYNLTYSDIGYLSPCDQLIYKAVVNALKPQCKYDTDKKGNYYQYPNCYRKKEDIIKDLNQIFSFLDNNKKKPSYDYSFYYDENWYYPSKPGDYINIYNHKPKKVRGYEKGRNPDVDNLNSKEISKKLIEPKPYAYKFSKGGKPIKNTQNKTCGGKIEMDQKNYCHGYTYRGSQRSCSKGYADLLKNTPDDNIYCNPYQYSALSSDKLYQDKTNDAFSQLPYWQGRFRGRPGESSPGRFVINPGWWEGQYNNHPIYHPIAKDKIDKKITSDNQELNNYYLDLSSVYKDTQDYWKEKLGTGWKEYCKNEEPDRELWTKVRDILIPKDSKNNKINDDDKKVINNNKKTCNESMTGKGEDYRGCQNKTKSGKQCMSWASAEKINLKGNSKEAEDGLGGHNFCRNPKGEKGSIWCYTGKGKTELCAPIGAKDISYSLVKKNTECKRPPWPFVGRAKTIKESAALASRYQAMDIGGGKKRKTTYFSVGHNRAGGNRCKSDSDGSGCRTYVFASDCKKATDRKDHPHYDLYRLGNRDEQGNDIKQKKPGTLGNEKIIKEIDKTIKQSKPGPKKFKVCSKFHLSEKEDTIDPYQCNAWMSDIYKIDDPSISSSTDFKTQKHFIDTTLQGGRAGKGLCKKYPELPECACYESDYNKYMLDELKIMASNNIPVGAGFKGCSRLHPCGTRDAKLNVGRSHSFYPEKPSITKPNMSMYSSDYWTKRRTATTKDALLQRLAEIEDKDNKILLLKRVDNKDYAFYMRKVGEHIHYQFYSLSGYKYERLEKKWGDGQYEKLGKWLVLLFSYRISDENSWKREKVNPSFPVIFNTPAWGKRKKNNWNRCYNEIGKKGPYPCSDGPKYKQWNKIIELALKDNWKKSYDVTKIDSYRTLKGWSASDRNIIRQLKSQINNFKDGNYVCPKSCSITFKAGNVYGNAQYDISQSCGKDVSTESTNSKTPTCGSITTKNALSYCSPDKAKTLGLSNSAANFFGKTGDNDNQTCSQPLTYPGGKALAPCHETIKGQQEKFMPLCCEQSCRNYSKDSCSKNDGACFMNNNMTSITSKTTCDKHKGKWVKKAFTGNLNKNLESIYPRKNNFCCETSAKEMVPDLSKITTEQLIHNLLEYIPYDIKLTKKSGSTEESLTIIKKAVMKDLFSDSQAKQKASEVLFTTYPTRREKIFTLVVIKEKLQKADNNIHKAYKQQITGEKIDELIQLIIIRLGYNPQEIHYFLDKDKAKFKVKLDSLDNKELKQQAINNDIKIIKDSSKWTSEDKQMIINRLLDQSTGDSGLNFPDFSSFMPDFSSLYKLIIDWFKENVIDFFKKNVYNYEGFQTNTKPKKNMIEVCIPICFLMICLCICICILKYSS